MAAAAHPRRRNLDHGSGAQIPTPDWTYRGQQQTMLETAFAFLKPSRQSHIRSRRISGPAQRAQELQAKRISCDAKGQTTNVCSPAARVWCTRRLPFSVTTTRRSLRLVPQHQALELTDGKSSQ